MSSLRWSRLLLAASLLSSPVAGITRTIGDPDDAEVRHVAAECLSMPGTGFGYGQCPLTIRCVMDNLTSDITAGMQSGSTIASLVPTILALIGAGPLTIVQLAFVSPLRAVATCVFVIGLPQNLFRQLSHHKMGNVDGVPLEPRTRKWHIAVPLESKASRSKSCWAGSHTAKGIAIDFVVLALAGIMIWRNVTLSMQTMVTWRCEYGFLLICWPMACVVWLMIAAGLLWLLSTRIQIRYSDDGPGIDRSWADLLRLTYRIPQARGKAPGQLSNAHDTREHAQAGKGNAVFIVRVTLCHDQSWMWYETTIEALAVGIYLYATFVLSSSLFISGSQGIIYMATMVLCLSAIRILSNM